MENNKEKSTTIQYTNTTDKATRQVGNKFWNENLAQKYYKFGNHGESDSSWESGKSDQHKLNFPV